VLLMPDCSLFTSLGHSGWFDSFPYLAWLIW
jgi:hypothetical protein